MPQRLKYVQSFHIHHTEAIAKEKAFLGPAILWAHYIVKQPQQQLLMMSNVTSFPQMLVGIASGHCTRPLANALSKGDNTVFLKPHTHKRVAQSFPLSLDSRYCITSPPLLLRASRLVVLTTIEYKDTLPSHHVENTQLQDQTEHSTDTSYNIILLVKTCNLVMKILVPPISMPYVWVFGASPVPRKQAGQSMQHSSGVWVLHAQSMASDSQALPQHRLGLLLKALPLQGCGQLL